MDLHRPSLHRQRSGQAAFLLALALALVGLSLWPAQGAAFVGLPGLRPLRAVEAQPRVASPVPLAAEAIDADVVGEEDEDDEDFEDEDEEEPEEEALADGEYPAEAYKEYAFDEEPSEAWFNRRKIDRHKVNSVFFDMFAKPKSFFPHKLQPGDTVRVFYMDPSAQDDGDMRNMRIKSMRETYFDGVILNFRGEYHARTMTLRAMVGKNTKLMGMELQFPMHSPLVRKIEVLRRGYIGRNKNAYFMRGMIGKKNIVPLDKERAQMDEMYSSLREAGREDEIPESEYPQQEWDRYPLPIWRQDLDDWDEEKYDPEKVDYKRNEFEKHVIARYKKRAPGPDGKAMASGSEKGR